MEVCLVLDLKELPDFCGRPEQAWLSYAMLVTFVVIMHEKEHLYELFVKQMYFM